MMKLDEKHLNSYLFNNDSRKQVAVLVVENDRNKRITWNVMPELLIHTSLLQKLSIMTQLVLWVDEGFRKTAGFKLMKAYEKKTDEYMAEGRIRYGVLIASKPLFDMDYSKVWLFNGRKSAG
jgi:hypothetical protein